MEKHSTEFVSLDVHKESTAIPSPRSSGPGTMVRHAFA